MKKQPEVYLDIEALFEQALQIVIARESGLHYPGLHQQHCAQCQRWFKAKRSDAFYCSNACRQKAYRQRGRN